MSLTEEEEEQAKDISQKIYRRINKYPWVYWIDSDWIDVIERY